MTRVAVAIVHFHAERLLADSLQALRDSELEDFSAVVVDNGSSEPLEESLADSRFELVRSGRNLGYAAATNLALAHLPAETPYVLLLNPDVIVEPDTLSAMVGALEEEPGAGAATPKLLLPSGELDPACRRTEPTPLIALSKQLGLQRLFPRSRLLGRYNLTYLDPDLPSEVDSGSGAFLLLRRQALERVGGRLDERFFLYGEDLDLCRRLREVGYRILYRPHARALHVKGSGRIRPLVTTVHFYRSMWIYYRKWGRGRRNPLVLAPLALLLAGLMAIEVGRNGMRRLLRRVT
jgi:GT2 family glycosyltransferase